MTPIPLDPELVSKLTSNGGQVPLTDTNGQPVGYFVSSEVYAVMRKAMHDQALAEITDEEVQRAFATPKRHTMDDVFKLLEGK
jgi:hypothetical protein